jgi:cell division protein FtsL
MALPLRRVAPAPTRPTPFRRPSSRPGIGTRRHGEVDRGPKVMVRATVGIRATSTPTLALVPRRRNAARMAVLLSALVVSAMLASAAFQTRVAQSQLELDRIDRDLSSSRENYDSLRRERAELRSPARLAEVAEATGMVSTDEVTYMDIDPATYAAVQQATGLLDDSGTGDAELLEQFRDVKAATDGTP